MTKIFDTLLLLALPASGKSEVRRYLGCVSPEKCERDFHMGATVQLDDFPYVHMMRRIDDELVKLGQGRLFFLAPDKSFQDGYDWGTLIQLVNEDYDDLIARRVSKPASAALHLLSRLEHAQGVAGARVKTRDLSDKTRRALGDTLEREAREMLDEKHANMPESLRGRTVVIEFARGGAHGAAMPLRAPMGYQFSLAQLSDAILATAAILYIWVTPEESRRKNAARTDPNDPGSILHHGVPIDVMMNDYGCDDIEHLLASSAQPGTVEVAVRNRRFFVPLARFDNRVDKTSFLRAPQADWAPADVRGVHAGLQGACTDLMRHYGTL